MVSALINGERASVLYGSFGNSNAITLVLKVN